MTCGVSMPQPNSLRPQLRSFVLAVWHLFLRTVLPPRSARQSNGNPKRILLINGAHLGDVVIATSLLPVLKSAFPQAEIGFLTATWSHPVIANHPGITYTHCADHWRMNRSNAGYFQKRFHYLKTRRQALRELRALHYDIAICMHPWRADFLPLTWQAGIPTRAAFSESLFAPLATHHAQYPEPHRFIHQSACQLRLLRALGIAETHLRLKQSSLPPSSPAARQEVCRLFGVSRLDEAPYSVIHMGSGNAAKELPPLFWREVALRIPSTQHVVFTGKGSREWSNAKAATAGIPNAVNLCDHLSWPALVAAIRYAQTFYGVDSTAAHVAAAVGTPCVALYAGITNLSRFRPESPTATVWANNVPCAPCDRQYGCPPMTCMQSFDPAQIVQIQKARAISQ